MSYEIEGHFVEACDCHAVCPCWIDHDPDDGECRGLIVWDITRGRIDDVVVSGLKVASASFHTGPRHGASQRVVLFVDGDADAGQRRALEEVFSGRAGGPLAELGDMLGELEAVQSARISLARTGAGMRIDVGRALSAVADPATGPSGGPVELENGALSTVLGSPARVGRASMLRMAVPKAGLDVDLTSGASMTGVFSYAA